MARRRRSSAVARFISWLMRPISLPVAGEQSGGTRRKTQRKRSTSSRANSNGDEALARSIERGDVSGEKLRDLMAKKKVRIKRNPRRAKTKQNAKPRRNPATLTAREKRELETARRMSKKFHGNSQVIELDAQDRQVPRFAVAVGEISDLTYSPNRGSKRRGADWHHTSGDRGPGKPRSRQKPLLVADPITKQPILLKHRSPMKFSSKQGLVG